MIKDILSFIGFMTIVIGAVYGAGRLVFAADDLRKTWGQMQRDIGHLNAHRDFAVKWIAERSKNE